MILREDRYNKDIAGRSVLLFLYIAPFITSLQISTGFYSKPPGLKGIKNQD